MVNITLKWNKISYSISVDPEAGVASLKEKIFSVTNVPTSRQTLLSKGAWHLTLKDDADLTTLLKEGLVVTLIGNAEVIAAPKETPIFVEDSEYNWSVKIYPPQGLHMETFKSLFIPIVLFCLGIERTNEWADRGWRSTREFAEEIEAAAQQPSLARTRGITITRALTKAEAESIASEINIEQIKAKVIKCTYK